MAATTTSLAVARTGSIPAMNIKSCQSMYKRSDNIKQQGTSKYPQCGTSRLVTKGEVLGGCVVVRNDRPQAVVMTKQESLNLIR